MDLLKVNGLCKNYPSFRLDNVSFSLQEGYIMGFIGRNGAGKTTTLKSMLHLAHPDSGQVEICGFNIDKDEFSVKKSVGFVSGTECFYPQKKLRTVSDVFSHFYQDWNKAEYERLISKFNLDENKKIKELSAGMKVKFQLALAMSHNARVLILDEPTSGLDPVSRDELVLLFQNYIEDGKHSVLFSTHITSDLEKCADYITYIHNGKIIESTDSVSFREKYVLVAGKNSDLDDESGKKIIGLHCNKFGFEGMMRADGPVPAAFEKSKPSFEDIMVHIEREMGENI